MSQGDQPKATIEDALALARTGDVDAALKLLEGRDPDERTCSMLFMLLTAKDRPEDALRVVRLAQAGARGALARSTWRLREGLLEIECGRTKEAQAALTDVLRMKASEDHVKQAQASLLATVKR